MIKKTADNRFRVTEDNTRHRTMAEAKAHLTELNKRQKRIGKQVRLNLHTFDLLEKLQDQETKDQIIYKALKFYQRNN